jgi:hypothetical protein
MPRPRTDGAIGKKRPTVSSNRRALALSEVHQRSRAPAPSANLAPLKRAPALSLVMAPGRAPTLSAASRRAPALSTVMLTTRRAPALSTDMATRRKTDAPPVGPRRRTDTPPVNLLTRRDDDPKSPQQRPARTEPRVTFRPRLTSTPTSVAVDPTSRNPRLQQATHRNLT